MADRWEHSWKLDVGSHTDVGRVRERNEDASKVSEDPAIFAVADGMGGHRAGDRASRLAVDTLFAYLGNSSSRGEDDIEELLVESFEAANRSIIEDASGRPDRMGMGTTLTVMVVSDGEAIIGHVGDSRALRVRDGEVDQLTDDHSIVAAQVREGGMTADEAKVHPMRHVLSRCMGCEPAPDVDVFREKIEDGDVIVLGSDGLTGAIPPDEIVEAIAGAENSEEASRKLVARARELDGSDNITAVVVACHSP